MAACAVINTLVTNCWCFFTTAVSCDAVPQCHTY